MNKSMNREVSKSGKRKIDLYISHLQTDKALADIYKFNDHGSGCKNAIILFSAARNR